MEHSNMNLIVIQSNDWQFGTAKGDVNASVVDNNYQKIISKASTGHGTIVLEHELTLPITDFFIDKYVTLSLFQFKYISKPCNL